MYCHEKKLSKITKNDKKLNENIRSIDQRTDQQTDLAAYRVAYMRLKINHRSKLFCLTATVEWGDFLFWAP